MTLRSEREEEVEKRVGLEDSICAIVESAAHVFRIDPRRRCPFFPP